MTYIKMNSDRLDRPSNSISFWTLLSLSLLVIVIGGAGVCYLVFGIVYLVEDYKIANDCKDSNLWEYVLVAMILTLPLFGTTKGNEEGNNIILLLLVGAINLGLSIWGGIELWNNSEKCDDLFNSNLWKVGLATFILQLFLSSLCFIFLPLMICCIHWQETIQREETTRKIFEPNLDSEEKRDPLPTIIAP